MATGTMAESKQRALAIDRSIDGATQVMLDGKIIWKGRLLSAQGAIGLLMGKHSHLQVRKFAISGTPLPGVFSSLYTEGLLSAGEQRDKKEGWAGWQEIESPRFRYGIGAVAREPESGRAKWNFVGTGFAIWAPRGPLFGQVEVVLDGKPMETVGLNNPLDTKSEPVFRVDSLRDDFHAVVLHGNTGRLVVDSIDVHVTAEGA